AIVLRPFRIVEVIREHGFAPLPVAVQRFRVRVEQQLARVAVLPLRGIPWAVDAVAVSMPGPDPRQIPVPAEGGDFGEVDAGLVPPVIEEAELDARRRF